MPNIVVTSTANVVKAVFNDVSASVGMTQGSWRLSEIQRVELSLSSDFVSVQMKDGTHWKVAYSGSDYPLVDSINAVAPTSNSDLFDKIEALMVT